MWWPGISYYSSPPADNNYKRWRIFLKRLHESVKNKKLERRPQLEEGNGAGLIVHFYIFLPEGGLQSAASGTTKTWWKSHSLTRLQKQRTEFTAPIVAGKRRRWPKREWAQDGEPYILLINSAPISGCPLNNTGVGQTRSSPAETERTEQRTLLLPTVRKTEFRVSVQPTLFRGM